MNEQTRTRRVETVHCLILGLSMFLVGLYFGTSLPAGVDLVVLQSGLIGFLGFLGLTQIQIAAAPDNRASVRSKISRSRRVERRLDRHTALPEPHRINQETGGRLAASAREDSYVADAVSSTPDLSSAASKA